MRLSSGTMAGALVSGFNHIRSFCLSFCVHSTLTPFQTATAFFFIQDKYEGRIIWFNIKGYFNKAKRTWNALRGNEEEEGATHPKILIRYDEALVSS